MGGRAKRCTLERGFTLVELIIVIGIIALLIALLFPSLRRAQSAARRVRCMANQRQLVTAWHLYAREFRGYIPLAYPDGGASGVNVAIDIQFIPWVIGDRRESAAPNYLPKGVVAHTDDWLLKAGSIYRYLRDVRVYRCPEHDPKYGVNEINISYAINNYCNGDGAPTPKVQKLNQIRRPGTTYVTIDQIDFSKYPKEEDEASGIMYTDWTHWYVAPPGPRHDLGSCLSFADGHVEYIKWARGSLWGTFGQHMSGNNTQLNATSDMLKLQALRGY